MLTQAERSYDYQVTEGRLGRENEVYNHGFTVGLLGDYLKHPADEYELEYFEPYVYDSVLPSFYLEAVEAGASERGDYTAEDLFIQAHEFDAEMAWRRGGFMGTAHKGILKM